MSGSKDGQGYHRDNFLERLNRAKSSFTGALGCRSGGGYISPIPRGRGKKKRERTREKGEYEKIPEEIKASPHTPVKSDRLSLESLALEYPREGQSERKEKAGPTHRHKTNGQLQPTSQRHLDDFSPRGENVGNFERGAASLRVGLPKSGKGKEKVDRELGNGHIQRDPLRHGHHEIEEVMDENETSSSALEKDSQPTNPFATGSSKHVHFCPNTEAVNVGEKDGFENLDRPPADFHKAFSSNSEVEEIGEVSNTLNKDSETLREEADRKAEEENRVPQSVEGVPEEKIQFGTERSESPPDEYTESNESSVSGKAGQNIVIPNAGSGYNLQGAGAEKMKALEQHESPVSVLSGALGSGRWGSFDPANNTPHPRADKFEHEIEEFRSGSGSGSHDRKTDVAEPVKEIGTPQQDSDNLRQTEDESSEAVEGRDSHHLRQDFATTNSHATGRDAIQEGRGSPSTDYSALFNEKGAAENKMEPNDPLQDIPGKESESGDFKPESSERLQQASKDGTQHSSQNLPEKHLAGEIDPMVQNGKQESDWNQAGSSDGRESHPSEFEREAQNSGSLQNVEGEKMQDGLHEKQIADGDDLNAPHTGDSPKNEGLGELLTEGKSETAANDVHHDGTHDPKGGVAGSTNLYNISTAGKDDKASLYGTGHYLGYLVVGVAVVVAVSYLHYRHILW